MQTVHKTAAAVAIHSALNDKIQTFLNAQKDSSVYVISCIRQQVAQDMVDNRIHVICA